jgi:ketosteroid isomerase-like protein
MAVSPEAELIRRWFAAFNRRDLQETLALSHPEIELRPLQLHGTRTWHGRDGVAAMWERMRVLGLDHQVEVNSVHELPGGELAVLGVVKPGDAEFVGIYRIEDALVRDVRHSFADEDTLRRLGLR